MANIQVVARIMRLLLSATSSVELDRLKKDCPHEYAEAVKLDQNRKVKFL